MKAIHGVCAVPAAFCAGLTGLGPVAAGASAAPRSGGVPIVRIAAGSVRGAAAPTGYEFLGLPYAAPPTRNRRWRPPQPPAGCAAIPGVIDGKILTESIGTALAAGRFAHVPILNGINHIEELIFVAGLHVTVSGGTFVPIPEEPVGPDGYQPDIAAVLGVSSDRAAAIAARYPLDAYPSADVALSIVVSDANFACPALQVDRWISQRVPTFAYQFNDDNAPERFAPIPAATHSSEIQYIFDQPNTPLSGTFTPDQQALASSMRAACASFAANGDPSTPSRVRLSFNQGEHVMSLVPPTPQVVNGFSDAHHCAFWAAGATTASH